MIIDIPLHIEESIIKYTTENKIDLNNLVSNLLIEYLEDLKDIELYKKGVERYNEYLENPVTYTHDELKKELGL